MTIELDAQCPSCSSTVILGGQDKELNCTVCGSHFPLIGHLCPTCLTYHQEDEGICSHCGAAMVVICRHCHTANWSGLESCTECGESIDIISAVAAHTSQSTAARLNSQMEEAQALKQIEKNASNKRMAELMAIEEARQAEIKQRLANQKEQERKLMIVMFSAVVLFIVALLIFALFSGMG